MTLGDSTCWSLIRGAREGGLVQRDAFVGRYAPLIQAYLEARWRDPVRRARIPEAVDEVFFQCFKEEGVLEHYEQGRGGGFRAYFLGVVRNVARNVDGREARRAARLIESEVADALPDRDEETASQAFDKAWGQAVLQEAGELLGTRAEEDGGGGRRMVDLLRLHVVEGVSMRELARRWEIDRQVLQRLLPKALEEFQRAVRDVLRDQLGDDPVAVHREWEVLESLIP